MCLPVFLFSVHSTSGALAGVQLQLHIQPVFLFSDGSSHSIPYVLTVRTSVCVVNCNILSQASNYAKSTSHMRQAGAGAASTGGGVVSFKLKMMSAKASGLKRSEIPGTTCATDDDTPQPHETIRWVTPRALKQRRKHRERSAKPHRF